MDERINVLIGRLNDLRNEERHICHELVEQVLQIPGMKEGLESGLVRLNFKAPEGFYEMLRRKRDKRE